MKRFLFISFFLFISLGLIGRSNPNQKDYNFFYFTKHPEAHNTFTDSLTPRQLRSNPDYGLLPYESPCEDCLELLEHRNATTRYFIEKKNGGSHFHEQHSYGAMNYKDESGWWREIDSRLKPTSENIFEADQQLSPVGINLRERETYITSRNKKIVFNKNLELYHLDEIGNMQPLGTPDWSHYTAGDEGVLIKDFYPGIDVQFIVYEGKLKTNFIINNRLSFSDGFLVMKQQFDLTSGLAFNLSETSTIEKDRLFGEISITGNEIQYARIHPSVAFDSQEQPSKIQLGNQVNSGNELITYLPFSWLNNPTTVYPVVLDPLVSASDSLIQSSITGSQYSPVCWTNGCPYNLSFPSPANCTISDIRFTFHYIALGLCTWRDGGISINYGSCQSPANGGHTCGTNGTGDCGLNNLSIINELGACLPPPQCTPVNMNFTMNFYRCSHDSTPGCNANCIAANGAWIMTIEGQTVQLQPGSLSPNQLICEGDSVQIHATAINGIPPYSYLWNPGGFTNNSVYVSPTSTTEYYITISDSCGLTLHDSTKVIVVPDNNPGFTITPNPACAGQPVAFTGLGGGASANYNWQFPNSNSPVVNGSQNPVVQYSSPGSFAATLTYANGTCSFPFIQNVTVDSVVTPSISINSNQTSPVCSGTSIIFTAAPVNGGSSPDYQWQVDGVNTGFNSDTFSVALNNTSSISVSMISNYPCLTVPSATSQVTVTVIPTVAPAVTITSNPSNPICSGTSVVFTSTPVFGGSNPAYQWQVNGLNAGVNSDTFSIATLANGDIVSVAMTSNATCAIPSIVNDSVQINLIPVTTPSVSITATPNDTVCSGSGIQFNAIPLNGGATPGYQWTLNGIAIPGAVSVSYSSNVFSNGDLIGVILTSSANCVTSSTARDSLPVHLLQNVTPAVTISVNPNDTICSGSNVIFTATPFNGGSSPVFQWQINGVNTGINSNTFSSSGLINGSIVSVSMTSNAICLTSSVATNQVAMTIVSNVTPGVAISSSPSTPVCPGTNVVFTSTPIFGGSAPDYQWQLNGNNVGGNSNSFIDSTLSNGDIISVTMTSNFNCASPLNVVSQPFVVTVNPWLTPSVSITSAPPDTICAGASIVFHALPVNGGTNPAYQWLVNGVTAGTNDSVFTTSALIPGNFVTVVMTSNEMCLTQTVSTSNSITINNYLPLTVVATGSAIICPKEPVTLHAQAAGGAGEPYRYQWSNGGGNSNDATVAPVTTTNYVVTANDACLGNPANASVIVNVLSAPVALYSYSPNDPSSYHPEVSFTDLSDSAISWSWNFGDGDSSTAENPVHLFPSAGTYNVSLAVTNSVGCKDTATFRIFVREDIALYIPNSFSPNGDGKNDVFGPMGTSLNDFEMLIYDRWGNVVFRGGPMNLWTGTMEPDKKPAPGGVYLYRIDLKDSKFEQQVITGGVTLIR